MRKPIEVKRGDVVVQARIKFMDDEQALEPTGTRFVVLRSSPGDADVHILNVDVGGQYPLVLTPKRYMIATDERMTDEQIETLFTAHSIVLERNLRDPVWYA